MHPAQQLPLKQSPLAQGVMSLTLVSEQVPVEQSAALHVLDVEHMAHDVPAVPHTARVFPVLQVAPSQQPLQQVPLLHVPFLHLVPAMAGTVPHFPPPQVSMVHAFLSSHSTHALPPAPQALEVAPGWHLPPLSTQPVQQVPLRQIPPVQAVPSLSPVEVHLPAAQVAEAQGPPPEQTEQAPPPAPQADRPLPGKQLVPLQHPAQQVPLLQVPPLQVVPAGAGVAVHLLWLQASMRQGEPEAHTEHLEPGRPQALTALPVWQAAPSQHPVQHVPL